LKSTTGIAGVFFGLNLNQVRFEDIPLIDQWIDNLSQCKSAALAGPIRVLISERNQLVQKQEEIQKAGVLQHEAIAREQIHQQEQDRKRQEAARIEQAKRQEAIHKAQLEQQELDHKAWLEQQEVNRRQQELDRIEKEKQQEFLRIQQLEQQRQQDEEQRQQDEACRSRCPKQLEAMLEELRSLALDEKGIERFKKLRQEHKDLVNSFPPDFKEAVKSLDDKFVASLSKRMVEVRKAEDDIRKAEEDRRIAEENSKKQSEVEGYLQILYGMQLILQVCTERNPEFGSSKVELQRIIKNRETSIPAERVTVVWNDIANRFQKTEPMMNMRSDYELYLDCDKTRKQVLGMMMSSPDATPPSVRPRRKDF
jgi:hypothetical protein